MSFKLISNAFKDNGIIPSKYTCEGEDVSPQLEWVGSPEGTKSFAIIVDDPDAPGGVWTHWIVYNIPPEVNKLEEGIKAFPNAAKQGENSWKIKGYKGPCPPSGEHKYNFKLYALKDMLKISHEVSSSNIEALIAHHVISKSILSGRYGKISANSVKAKSVDIRDATTILRRKDVNESIKERARKEIEREALNESAD